MQKKYNLIEEEGFITENIIRIIIFIAKCTSILLFFYTYSDYKLGKNHEIKYSANRVDIVISCLFIFEILSFLIVGNFLPLINWIILTFALLRIVNIVSFSLMNILIQTRGKSEDKNYLISFKRSFILAIINYIELIILFAILYSLLPDRLLDSNKNIVTDKFSILYFSNITQLTIGYGDITPLGKIRFLACLQGLIGVFLLATNIAKLVAVIPLNEKNSPK